MLIGNHTEAHLYATELTTDQVTAEIVVPKKDITAVSGQLWDVDPDDWKRPPTKVIVERVVSKLRPGAVILMHDRGGDRSRTIATLSLIITKLKAEGYVFVTIDGLKSMPPRKK